jgi:hypothetical protein
MANRIEHLLFKKYTEALINWTRTAVYLHGYPQEYNVNIDFLQPPKAFVKYIVPILNGSNLSPTVCIVPPVIEYLDAQNNLGWVYEYSLNGTKYKKKKPELVYSLTYQAIIWSRRRSESDILLYQFLSSAPKNRKAAFIVDGQWSEDWATNPRDETNLDPGTAQDVVLRHSIDLIIPRAYLPMDYLEYGRITEVDFDVQANGKTDETIIVKEENMYKIINNCYQPFLLNNGILKSRSESGENYILVEVLTQQIKNLEKKKLIKIKKV